MRTIKYRRTYGVGKNSAPWENITLEQFVLLIPSLGQVMCCSKVMPPFVVLNEIFNNGESNQGMGGSIEWKSFEINKEEYYQLVEYLCTDPKLDKELDSANTFREWRSLVMKKYNARKNN